MNLKNKLLKTFILMIVCASMLLFTGCFEDYSVQLACDHEYTIIENTASCKEMGTITYKCDKCGREMTVRVESSGHTYEEVEKKEATCQEEGYLKEKCSVCGEERTTVLEKTSHDYGDWVTTKEMTSASDGEEERECKVCGEKETRLISRLPDMDLSIITCGYTVASDNKYKAEDFEALSLLFNMGLLNRVSTMEIDLKFKVDDFDTLFNNLLATKSVPFDYKVESSFEGIAGYGTLVLNFTFYDVNKSTEKAKTYTQYDSLNTTEITATRSADFDDFKINKVANSYSVSTTEQLVYVLEHRVKPVPVVGSDAERIYNKIKTVLRSIINDDMDDYQKVKAIHDWLIMNVTYDQELLTMLGTADDTIKNYDGFYLEGVFDKGYAVCEGISKALCVLANVEGIPCVRVSGHETGNQDSVGHAWNKIYIDGKWYIIDATSDGTIVGGQYEVLSYAYFLISDATMEERYTGEEYTDLKCNENYDVLANTSFKYQENTYTFSAKSRSDLEKIVSYFTSTEKTNITIQVKLDYEYTKYSEEFSAVSKASFSYLTQGDYYMLVK